MNLHFESTSLGPGFDISMQLKQFFNRAGQMEIAQNELYVNGVKFGKNHEFPLPQLEPEKVLTQPLELKLNERYKYKLLGTEQVNGALCYVVGVEPLAADENLYSGKIWIDGTTFREVRQTLSQRGSKNNVLVNVETQNFELVRDDKGNQFNLLRSISAQQLLNAAGRDFVLQRTVQFSDYIINTPLFAYDLDAEHSSKDPMYRETDEGLRSLEKKGGERVLVGKRETRITSLIAGAMYGGHLQLSHSVCRHQRRRFQFPEHRRATFDILCRAHPGLRSLQAVPTQVPPGVGPGALRAPRREPHLQRQHGIEGRRRMGVGRDDRTAGVLAGHHAPQPDGLDLLVLSVLPRDQRRG